MINKNYFVLMLVGFLTGYVSMLVEANKLRKEYPSEEMYWKINFGKQYMRNPLMYGIIAMVIFYLVMNFLPEKLQRYWLVGIIMGIIIPSIKMINNYAMDVYGVTVGFLYSWDIFFYTCLYTFVLGPLANRL